MDTKKMRICSHLLPDPGGEVVRECLDEIERLREVLRQIGDYAHDHSTGPAVPDALWEVRSMAYEA